MAVRILQGQVPHRDYVEIYTGGLSFLNALAFRLFGVNLLSMRIMLFLFFLGWVPAVYLIARRFVSPWAAAAVTLLSVAWSVPNYPEAMPSWYNLFFTTWGMLALMRQAETGRRRWLWIAGMCAGLSFLVKIVGLYFVAAALLYFVYRELLVSRSSPGAGRKAFAYQIFASGCLLLFVAALANLILQRPSAPDISYFVLPSVCLVALLLWILWRDAGARSWERFGSLFSMILPFLGGALVPVAIFLGYFVKHRALGSLFSGMFGEAGHITWAALDPPSALVAVGLVPMAAVFLFSGRPNPRKRRASWIVAAGLVGAALLLSRFQLSAYEVFGLSLLALIPAVALWALWRLRQWQSLDPGKCGEVFLAVAVAVLFALIQFPYSNPTYFCYVAPLLALALTALLSTAPGRNRVALGSVLAFYLGFAMLLHAPGFFAAMNRSPMRPVKFQTLDLPRAGGIRVPAEQAKEFDELVPFVQGHARGSYVYCTPNCPEIYFLTDRSDPIGVRLQSEGVLSTPPLELQQQILETLALHNVQAIVLGPQKNSLAPPLAAGLKIALGTSFPHSKRIDEFEVRWR